MKCIKNGCKDEQEKNGLCNKHYWFSVWLDNRDQDNLGIVKFAEMILPHWIRDEVPEFHKEMYYNFMQLYSPKHKDKYDRLLAEIAFRGGAKTTRAKVLLTYICCFGLEKFVIYCSETHPFAVQDVFEVRRELSSNPYIKKYFGIISSRAVKGEEGDWRRDAFLTSTGVYVLARGVGNQVRSALRNSYRPTLAIINDMYSKDSVKTEYTREQYAKWFFQDMFNAVDDIDGKVFFNGTILHEDTVPVTLRENNQWKLFEYPVIDVDDFHNALTYCKITDTKIHLPSEEKIAELEKGYRLAWPTRLTLRYILRKYAEAYQSNQAAGFYQEYLHVVVPPGEKNFKTRNHVEMRLFRHREFNFLAVNFGGREVVYEVNIFLGVDPASATTKASKFTALVYVAMNKDRQIFVLGYSHGKYGLRDEYKTGQSSSASDRVEMDTTKLLRIGMVDEEIRLVKRLRVHSAIVETVQQQQSVYDEINRLMRVNGAMHRLHGVKPTQEKIERDADILTPYFETGSIFFASGLVELEHELNVFPRGTTVDLVDALAYAVSIARPPYGVDYADVTSSSFLLRKKKNEFSKSFMSL